MFKRVKKLCTHHHRHNKNKKNITNPGNHDVIAPHEKTRERNINVMKINVDNWDISAAVNALSCHGARNHICKTIPTSPPPPPTTTTTTCPPPNCTNIQALNLNDESTDNKNTTTTTTTKKHGLRKHLFRKHKSNENVSNDPKHRKHNTGNATKAKGVSLSTDPEELTRSQSTPAGFGTHQKDVKEGRLKKDYSETFSRSSGSSASSLEMLRENRRSVINKLDEYINYVKKSADEGNMASVPNRLCCAQLLRTVYLRREQQIHYQSLHPRHRSKPIHISKHDRRPYQYSSSATHLDNVHSSSSSSSRLLPTTSAAMTTTTSRSLQDFRNANDSFDCNSNFSQSPDIKPRWQQGSTDNSDASSVNSNDMLANNNDNNTCSLRVNSCHDLGVTTCTGLQNKANHFSFDDDDDDNCSTCNNNNNTGFWNSTSDLNNNTNDKSLCYGNSNDFNSNRKLTKNSHRKSMPLFPQALDIDIY